MKCPKCGGENIGQTSDGNKYNEFNMPINNTIYICSSCGFQVGRWEDGKIVYSKYRKPKPKDDTPPEWRRELSKVRQCLQRQDALNNQLEDLIIVADRLGFYDASDFITRCLEKSE